MKKYLLALGIMVHEKPLTKTIMEHWDKEMNPEHELSNQIKKFFHTYIKDDKVAKLLKLMTHIVLAPPYLRLKNSFASSGLDVKDMSGVWEISLVFRNNDIYVVHEKKAVNSKNIFYLENFIKVKKF